MRTLQVLSCASLALCVSAILGCVKESVPPAAPDEVVFQPTGKYYAREPQTAEVMRVAPQFVHVTLNLQTVADAAQIYADFARKEVRVPRSLLERKLTFANPNTKVAYSYVVQSFVWQLPYDGVEIVTLGRKAIAFRAGKTFQEQMLAKQPPMATPEQVAAARKAMSEDRFWEMIESARQGAKNDCFKLTKNLETRLRTLSTDEIFGFEIQLNERLAESYRLDLWAVAYIVNGGASDDGFEYFRGWLVTQGRDYFRAAMKDPVRAADRAERHGRNECEQMLYPALQAYQGKTNQYPPQYRAPRPSEPTGPRWSEEDLPKLYPQLVKKFR